MEYEISRLFSYDEVKESPRLRERKEFLKLAISRLMFRKGKVSFRFHISYMFPTVFSDMVGDIHGSIYMVVMDIGSGDGFRARLVGSGRPSSIERSRGPGVSDFSERDFDSLDGGWINGDVSLFVKDRRPGHKLLVHAEIESYSSNLIEISMEGGDKLTAKAAAEETGGA